MKTNAKSLKATDDVAGKAAKMPFNRVSQKPAYPFNHSIGKYCQRESEEKPLKLSVK